MQLVPTPAVQSPSNTEVQRYSHAAVHAAVRFSLHAAQPMLATASWTDLSHAHTPWHHHLVAWRGGGGTAVQQQLCWQCAAIQQTLLGQYGSTACGWVRRGGDRAETGVWCLGFFLGGGGVRACLLLLCMCSCLHSALDLDSQFTSLGSSWYHGTGSLCHGAQIGM